MKFWMFTERRCPKDKNGIMTKVMMPGGDSDLTRWRGQEVILTTCQDRSSSTRDPTWMGTTSPLSCSSMTRYGNVNDLSDM